MYKLGFHGLYPQTFLALDLLRDFVRDVPIEIPIHRGFSIPISIPKCQSLGPLGLVFSILEAMNKLESATNCVMALEVPQSLYHV